MHLKIRIFFVFIVVSNDNNVLVTFLRLYLFDTTSSKLDPVHLTIIMASHTATSFKSTFTLSALRFSFKLICYGVSITIVIIGC